VNPVLVGHLMYVGAAAIAMTLIFLAGYFARRFGGTR